jgi:methyl-accepting chemotaxis protein
MTEQGATTEDIARNVQEAATAAKAIADNLSDVTGRVDDVNKVSSQVETASGGLSRDISSLRDALARAG